MEDDSVQPPLSKVKAYKEEATLALELLLSTESRGHLGMAVDTGFIASYQYNLKYILNNSTNTYKA